jgi:hypothetical protein
MLENATNLINVTYCIGLLGKLKTPINTVVILTTVGILTGVALMHFRYMGAKGRVKHALIDFASSWELLQVKERLNMHEDIIPVVKKGETIKEAVENIPTTLTSRDFSCALDIAIRLDLIKTSFETKNPSEPFGSRVPDYNTSDIDEFAKRARKCVEELERWGTKKWA